MGPIIVFGCIANNNPSHLSSLVDNDTWGEVNGSVWAKCLHGHFFIHEQMTFKSFISYSFFSKNFISYSFFQHMNTSPSQGPSIPVNRNLLLPLVSFHVKPSWFLQQDVSLPLALTLQMPLYLG